MLKASLVFLCLLITGIANAHADIREIVEGSIVGAIDSPIVNVGLEEDAPGCNTKRYTFGDSIFSMKIEFKCDRINVAWSRSNEPENTLKSQHAAHLAQRAVVALTQADGSEVERVLSGAVYKGRSFPNGLTLSGTCVMTSCLLTFK